VLGSTIRQGHISMLRPGRGHDVRIPLRLELVTSQDHPAKAFARQRSTFSSQASLTTPFVARVALPTSRRIRRPPMD
jgi:hypothetical protein